MFLITLVAVILPPASVINSKPRSIRRNISVASLLPFFLSLSRPLSFPSPFFSHRIECPHLCGNLPSFLPSSKESPSRRDCARRTGENRSRPAIMSRVRRGTDDSIISGMGDSFSPWLSSRIERRVHADELRDISLESQLSFPHERTTKFWRQRFSCCAVKCYKSPPYDPPPPPSWLSV